LFAHDGQKCQPTQFILISMDEITIDRDMHERLYLLTTPPIRHPRRARRAADTRHFAAHTPDMHTSQDIRMERDSKFVV